MSLFISATRGFVQNLTSLLNNYSSFDLKTRTEVTGRTLLHAAVGSGHLEGGSTFVFNICVVTSSHVHAFFYKKR